MKTSQSIEQSEERKQQAKEPAPLIPADYQRYARKTSVTTRTFLAVQNLHLDFDVLL
jgi:hypothetical protein